MNAANKPSVAAARPSQRRESRRGRTSARPHRQHSAAAPRAHRRRIPERRILRQSRMVQSRRLREGSRRLFHDPRRRTPRRPAPRQNNSRRHQRQHRHRLRHDRRRARLSRETLPAHQRLARTQTHSRRPTASKSSTRPATKAPTAPSAASAKSTNPIAKNIFIRTSTAIPQIPPRTTPPPPRKSGSRRTAPITHFVAGLGTSGTFVGTTRRLKELNPAIRCISFQPDSGFHGLEGLKHMATAIVPRIYDPNLADEDIAVRTEDAHQIVRRLAREEGILGGVSSGAALWACMDVARRLPAGRARRDRHRLPRFRRKISQRTILERRMSGLSLKIREELVGQIHAHGVETYPHECCGAILGRDGDASREVLALLPLANRRDDSPRNRFEVTPGRRAPGRKNRAREEYRADRLVSFASGRSGAPQRIRSRARLALVQLHHRQRAEGRAARYDFLALARRSRRLRLRGD